MPGAERQQVVLDLLKGLRGLDPLKQLFWTELNYQRVNQPLSRRGWTETAADALADDPLLFAAGGEDNAFEIIYTRLKPTGQDESEVASRRVSNLPARPLHEV